MSFKSILNKLMRCFRLSGGSVKKKVKKSINIMNNL